MSVKHIANEQGAKMHIGDLSYQEYRNIVDVREDSIGSGKSIVSFRDIPSDLGNKVITWFSELSRRGDKNLSKEYLEFFNLQIERL